MSIRGIDVSDYQPNVNWQAVAREGIVFGFVKSTEGATLVSQTFARNWAAMKSVGIQRGAYHFFRPASSVQGQIDLFLKTVKLEPGDLPAVLDIETTGGLSGGELCDRAAIWLAAVEKATQMRPIIYTYPGFWDNLGTTRFADYPLWIAHYTSAEQPWIPGWKSWTFWQYSDTGSVVANTSFSDSYCRVCTKVAIAICGPKFYNSVDRCLQILSGCTQPRSGFRLAARSNFSGNSIGVFAQVAGC